jgi:hypothetical protein
MSEEPKDGPDRFELEDALTEQWQISDDLDLLAEQILESGLNEDDTVNVLVGLAALHRMRCSKTSDIFEALLSTGQLR